MSSSSSSSSAEPQNLYQPGLQPLNNRQREKDPAFDNPNVRQTITKLRTQLREASRKTGDIKADVHQLITIPNFQNELRQGNQQLQQLKGNFKSKSGRPIPSKPYGWFQSFVDSYFTNYCLKICHRAIAQGTNPNVRSFRIKYATAIRYWWVQNRDNVLNGIINDIKRQGFSQYINTSPVLGRALGVALNAAGNNYSSPSKTDSDALHATISNLN